MAAPKAAIIGVLGQGGGYLAQLLLNKGYEVHGTSRAPERVGSSPLQALGLHRQVRLHAMMPTDFSSVLPFLQQVGADEIYNLSGQSSVASSFRQPLETFASITTATMNFLECIRLLGREVRYYNASSSEMFGNTPTPADEATPFRPRSPYATAKAAAHHAVANYREAYGLRACSGILFNHESPFRPEQFVTRKVVCAARRIAAGSPERLSLGNVEIDVADAAAGAIRGFRDRHRPHPFAVGICRGCLCGPQSQGPRACRSRTTSAPALRHRLQRRQPGQGEAGIGLGGHKRSAAGDRQTLGCALRCVIAA